MLNPVWLFLIVSLPLINGQQPCRGRLNTNITGICTATADCSGQTLSADVCEARSCCVSNSTQPLPIAPDCVNTPLFTQRYNTSRGRYVARILNYALNQAGICNNCRAKAAFLAIAAAMTNDFLYDEAVGADRSFSDDDRRFGNTGSGDGSRYRRRGLFGIRGRARYQRIQSFYSQYPIFTDPQLAATPIIAAQIAADLWKNPTLQSGGNTPLTSFADGTFYSLSMLWYKLTNGTDGLAEIAKKYSFFLRLYGCGGDLYPGQGGRCNINSTTQGYCVPMCLPGMEDVADACGCSGETTATCSDGPAHIRCCADTCSQELKMDLGLVLDSSGSIGAQRFQLLKDFVKDLLRQVNVGENKTHVGIINYSAATQIRTYLNQQYSLAEKIAIVDATIFLNSGTNTAAALQQANSVFDTSRGLRLQEEGALPVIFVITDGASENERATIDAAAVLKRKGIHIVSVGVGDSLRLSELYAICTPPYTENYFPIADYQFLENRLNQFVSKSCSEPAVIPSNTTVTTDVTGGKYKFFKLKIVVNGNKVMIKVKLVVGKVKVFFSFTSRNPKDPQEFINYATSKTIPEESGSWFGSAWPLVGGLKKSNQNEGKAAAAKESFVTVVVEKPIDMEKLDEVNVGVKGVESENQFEMNLEDCELVFCPSGSIISTRLNLLVAVFCLFLSIRLF